MKSVRHPRPPANLLQLLLAPISPTRLRPLPIIDRHRHRRLNSSSSAADDSPSTTTSTSTTLSSRTTSSPESSTITIVHQHHHHHHHYYHDRRRKDRPSSTAATTNATTTATGEATNTTSSSKMPRSPEAQSFYHAVYSAVQEIPYGKVTTYGHIAKLVGTPQRARQVGICLKHLPNPPSATTDEQTTASTTTEYATRFNHDTVPWQRVINAKGIIPPRSQPSGARNQAAALELEGVTVTTGALGEFMVDFSEYGWFPRRLPSEVAEGMASSDEDFDSQRDEVF